jgi:glutathione S-transferase
VNSELMDTLAETSALPHLDVYGQDHSPWVQAVLLGLHDKGVPHSLTTVPPASVFRQWGVMMPAASVDGAPWQLESAEILQQIGYQPISSEDLVAIYDAWQGVTHRADGVLRFFRAFSLASDPQPSLLPRLRNHFLRSFAVLYFYLLIRFMVLARLQQDPEDFGDQFLDWEQRLETSAGAYLGGDEPDMLDMMLFGIIQCHCSIPVPPVDALQKDPRLRRLRSWIGAMQERSAGYAHLYSGVYFDPPSPAPMRTTALEQAAFWLGSAFMLTSFPITIPLILFFALRVPRRPLKS